LGKKLFEFVDAASYVLSRKNIVITNTGAVSAGRYRLFQINSNHLKLEYISSWSINY